MKSEIWKAAFPSSRMFINVIVSPSGRVTSRSSAEISRDSATTQGRASSGILDLPAAGWFRAAGASLPSTQVGGDYFDVRQISPNLWTAVVADVSGKGVSSALLASLLQGTFLMGAADSSQRQHHPRYHRTAFVSSLRRHQGTPLRRFDPVESASSD